MRFAWMLACDPEVGPRWRYSGHVPSFESFASEFWSDVVSHQIITRMGTAEPLGLLTIYGGNFANQYVHVATAVRPRLWGVGVVATLLSLRYCFETWPVRKVYFETHSGNIDQFGSGIGKLFDLEATIPEHQWFSGAWVDKIVLATYRKHVDSYVIPTLGRLGI